MASYLALLAGTDKETFESFWLFMEFGDPVRALETDETNPPLFAEVLAPLKANNLPSPLPPFEPVFPQGDYEDFTNQYTNGVYLSLSPAGSSSGTKRRAEEELERPSSRQRVGEASFSPPPPSPPPSSAYEPIPENLLLPGDLGDEAVAGEDAPLPAFPAYRGQFKTSEEARKHRRRGRTAPKSGATDYGRVKRYGRPYWVQRIYESIIDISHPLDGRTSATYKRIAGKDSGFEADDLEATAHHVFDQALAVHERGFTYQGVYHKEAKRGKSYDHCDGSVEKRLQLLCTCLRRWKATVDDAVRGGLTLALLCDNPKGRLETKASNLAGNKAKADRLKEKAEKGKGKKKDEEEGGGEEKEVEVEAEKGGEVQVEGKAWDYGVTWE